MFIINAINYFIQIVSFVILAPQMGLWYKPDIEKKRQNIP